MVVKVVRSSNYTLVVKLLTLKKGAVECDMKYGFSTLY